MTRDLGGGAVQRRERRVVVGGAVVLALALLVTYGVVPATVHWRAREQQLLAASDQVAALRGVLAQGAALERAAAQAEASLAGSPVRVLHARSNALGASALQALLQGAADGSGLLVNRVDVGTTPDDGGALTATMLAYGDIHGLSALLEQLAGAPRLVSVERLTVQINPALRGAPDVLQLSIGVRAPVVVP